MCGTCLATSEGSIESIEEIHDGLLLVGNFLMGTYALVSFQADYLDGRAYDADFVNNKK